MGNKFSSKAFGALIAAGAFSLFMPSASATGGTNTIVDITMEGSQFARVSLAGGAIGGRPGCHNAAYTVHYQWDISTAKGRAMLDALRDAQLNGKLVSLNGGAACTTAVVTLETLTGITVWT